MGNKKEISGEKFSWEVKVYSEAYLDDWIRDYFAGLEIWKERSGNTLLTGKMQDLPEVYGLILKLRDAGVVLLSLQLERVQGE